MVTRKDIKNKYYTFRSISKIFVILLILGFSQTAPAQQWESIFGGESPGVSIIGEYPSCWFSPSHTSTELPSEITQYNIQYNSLGQVVEYYVEGTANDYPIETHIYDGTYNSLGQVSGFKEYRYYPTSGNAYNIIVSNVKYDGFGNVKDGYFVTVDQNSPTIPSKNASDYISDINIGQIWDYGDPTDSTDLTYEFNLAISSFNDTAKNINTSVNSIEFITPAGYTFQIPKLPGQWSDGIWTLYQYEYFEYDPNTRFENAVWEYRARLTNLADLQAYGDGEYTIILHHADGSKSQTAVWFGIPDTNYPVPQPTQEPILNFPLHNQTAKSPVTFTWELSSDPNTEYIFIDVHELGTAWLGDKWGDFEKTETSWGPVYLPDGLWDADLFFASLESPSSYYNDDGIWIDTFKYSKSRSRFTVKGSPWTMYEVWGGDNWIDWNEGGYGNIANLETNGFKNLGKSDGQTDKFTGQYQYYIIATIGEFLLDSIQGSDGSFYLTFEPNNYVNNIYDKDNLLGPQDGQCAIVGMNNPWDDYSGYFVFTNPGNWKGLTVITSDLNLNLNKNIVGTIDQTEKIAPNDTITYRIHVDSNDFTQDVTDVTVVDILPDEVSFVPVDSNEVSGTYDPEIHTYSLSYPSLAPASAIELQLKVQVNADVAPGTTITNLVTINSNETPPYTTSINLLVSEISQVEADISSITPNVLRRNGTGQYITAVVQFPEGINQRDINLNDQPELYYQDRNTGELILIEKGSAPVLSGTGDRPQISISFNRAGLINKLYGYGEFKLRIKGELNTNQSYSGEGSIYLTRFAGD